MNPSTEHACRMAQLDDELSFLSADEFKLICKAEADYRRGRCSKIGCIKRIRDMAGWGLKDTKDFVEWRAAGRPDVEHVAPRLCTDTAVDLAAINKQLEDRVKLLESNCQAEQDAHNSLQDDLFKLQDENSMLCNKVRCLTMAMRELLSVMES